MEEDTLLVLCAHRTSFADILKAPAALGPFIESRAPSERALGRLCEPSAQPAAGWHTGTLPHVGLSHAYFSEIGKSMLSAFHFAIFSKSCPAVVFLHLMPFPLKRVQRVETLSLFSRSNVRLLLVCVSLVATFGYNRSLSPGCAITELSRDALSSSVDPPGTHLCTRLCYEANERRGACAPHTGLLSLRPQCSGGGVASY